VTDYAMFANARTFAHVLNGELAASSGTATADALGRMSPGERVVPLYEPTPFHGDEELRALNDLADRLLRISGTDLLTAYDVVAGTVPHVLRVTGVAHEQHHDSGVSLVVPVEIEPLASAVPAADFLRLRALNETVASQFKGSAPARPIQEVPRSLITGIRAAAEPGRDDRELLRSLSLVAAQDPIAAGQLLADAGRPPREGDMAFLVTRAAMPGLVSADASGVLAQPQQPIARTPESIKALLVDAQRKAAP